jgi:mono/diheme cytochrome c family protein
MTRLEGAVREDRRSKLLVVGTTLFVLLVGCSNAEGRAPAAQQSASSVMRAPATFSLLANGKAIYQTGRDLAGVQIVAGKPPLFHSCAACHRADGSGGMHLPNGAVSADLRHRALVTQQKHPYTLRLLERAISTGIDNEGKPLNPVMPRWRLSPRDLHDVAAYVLTLK